MSGASVYAASNSHASTTANVDPGLTRVQLKKLPPDLLLKANKSGECFGSSGIESVAGCQLNIGIVTSNS